ncbi:MAG: radical SAM protein [Planctomycetota bacterium]|nr:radical SAM protein [Planctomycetota bacterium]
MVTVTLAQRKSAVLTPSGLACLAGIPTINLTAGCPHGCLYCYSQGYSCYPGRGRVVLYANALEKLKSELARKRKRPQAVYFSPASDLFQPVPEVLEMAYGILEYLLAQGIGVAFLTKGRIPEGHMELLRPKAAIVRAQVGLVTLDPDVAARFEPGAPRPADRLAQIHSLVAGGIRTQVRLDPILPGVTDDRGTLSDLLAALAQAGVDCVAASTLFLRPALANALKAALPEEECRKLLGHFKPADRLAIHAEHSTVTALPLGLRREILTRVADVARRHGLHVNVCACKNPDLPSQCCGIAGDWPADGPQAAQHPLFGTLKQPGH